MSAQDSLVDRLNEMQQNPRLKEKVYVHTNKTTYFTDDIIWFKAYVGDSINYPSSRTRILEVRLFDVEGTQRFSHTVAISSGAGHGQIALNDSVAPGTYYLRARTHYMRNFGEDYQYLQEIAILGKALPAVDRQRQRQYDVQLLPESGNLIEGVENVLGIKAMLHGKGVDFHGTILNSRGDTITQFRSEHRGMGKCSFRYTQGESYRAKVRVLDTLIDQAVPAARQKGIALSLDTSEGDYVDIRLKTNEATLQDQLHANYTLLYHQDHQLIQLLSIVQLNGTNGLVRVNKDLFLDGVHTVTLLVDDEPAAERRFFIETNRKKTVVSIEKSKVDQDSITYRLRAKGTMKNPAMDLSVSILHKETKALSLKNTMESAFLLEPYVRSTIENPAYYFDSKNEKRKEHLDLLLLTQGWTQYTLDEFIRKINPDEKYEFQQGFELRGTLKKEGEFEHLVLIPKDLRITDIVDVKGESDFIFQNLNVFKGDMIRVAYQDASGKFVKPTTIVYDTTYHKNSSKLLIPKGFEYYSGIIDTTTVSKTMKIWERNPRDSNKEPENRDGIIDLDEVIVTDNKLSQRYLQRRNTIAKYKPLVSDIGKYYDLPLPDISNNATMGLMDFMARQGFLVRTTDNGESYLGGHRKIAPLFINGRFIPPEELTALQLPLKDIENIMVNNLGYDAGAEVSFMIYQVFTSTAFGQEKNRSFDEFVIKNGFDKAKKYYAPRYNYKESRPLDLLEVDWKPNLKTDKKGEVRFKIAKDEKTEGLLFVIQGFSNEGHLISKTILMD